MRWREGQRHAMPPPSPSPSLRCKGSRTWRGPAEGPEERDAIFTLVQNTRRPNIRVLRSLLHCAKRDRALRRKIGHGRETEEGCLGESFFLLRGWRFLPTTSQIKGKQLREIINRSVTKGMSRRHEIAQKPRKEREFIIGPFVQILDYYVLLIRQKMWRRNHLSSPQIGYEFFQDLPSK